MVALAGPGELGAKVTETEHFPFGPTWPLQIEVENSLDPETLPPLKVTITPLFFFEVLVSITPLTLLLPTLTVPKFREPLESCTIAGTLGVGVGFGVGVGAGVGVAVGEGIGVAVAVGVGVGVAVAVGVGDGLGLEPV
jgi:hypothetical protein